MDENPRVLLATVPELIGVAQGDPMRFHLDDGTEVLVRLPTIDEVIQQQRDAIEQVRARTPGWEPPPLMSREQAVKLSAPLSLPAGRRG